MIRGSAERRAPRAARRVPSIGHGCPDIPHFRRECHLPSAARQRPKAGSSIPHSAFPIPHTRRGFTLIEVLIVVTIIGILITMAQPSFHRAVTSAKEATLKENLFVLRDVLDQFFADNAKYPDALEQLVEKRYLRRVPKDPVTGSADTWVLVRATDEQGQEAGIFDVHSGSEGTALDGTRYADW